MIKYEFKLETPVSKPYTRRYVEEKEFDGDLVETLKEEELIIPMDTIQLVSYSDEPKKKRLTVKWVLLKHSKEYGTLKSEQLDGIIFNGKGYKRFKKDNPEYNLLKLVADYLNWQGEIKERETEQCQ